VRALKVLGDNNAMILRNHGVLATGAIMFGVLDWTSAPAEARAIHPSCRE
jgi:hypothetical protein